MYGDPGSSGIPPFKRMLNSMNPAVMSIAIAISTAINIASLRGLRNRQSDRVRSQRDTKGGHGLRYRDWSTAESPGFKVSENISCNGFDRDQGRLAATRCRAEHQYGPASRTGGAQIHGLRSWSASAQQYVERAIPDLATAGARIRATRFTPGLQRVYRGPAIADAAIDKALMLWCLNPQAPRPGPRNQMVV
jgi:hypothetical protein